MGLTTKNLIIYGDYFIQLRITKINNIFWKDVLNSWVLFQQKLIFVHEEEILSLNILNNNDILMNRKLVIYKNYFEKGIIFCMTYWIAKEGSWIMTPFIS